MRLTTLLTLTTALVALPFAAHAQDTTATPAQDAAPSLADPHFGAWGIDLTGMDTSVKPGDNFFDYVNGAADARLVIPADKTSNGVNEVLEDLSENRSKAIVEGLAAKAGLTGDDAKIAALYNAMMDTATVEKLDAAPLKPTLDAIAAIQTRDDMAAYMGRSNSTFGSSFFGANIDADAKNPKINTLYIGQGGLGLPDLDYYLTDTYADKKAAYEAYVAQMLGMAGYPDPAKNAHDIVALETAIAGRQLDAHPAPRPYRHLQPDCRKPTSPPTLPASTGPPTSPPPACKTPTRSSSAKHRLPQDRQGLRRYAARYAESLGSLPHHRPGRALPVATLRRRFVGVQEPQDAWRPPSSARAGNAPSAWSKTISAWRWAAITWRNTSHRNRRPPSRPSSPTSARR
ncbi:MAG: M13 family metallopeptidase N-terminal domain-containing protein [Asticcacaulis sp.]